MGPEQLTQDLADLERARQKALDPSLTDTLGYMAGKHGKRVAMVTAASTLALATEGCGIIDGGGSNTPIKANVAPTVAQAQPKLTDAQKAQAYEKAHGFQADGTPATTTTGSTTTTTTEATPSTLPTTPETTSTATAPSQTPSPSTPSAGATASVAKIKAGKKNAPTTGKKNPKDIKKAVASIKEGREDKGSDSGEKDEGDAKAFVARRSERNEDKGSDNGEKEATIHKLKRGKSSGEPEDRGRDTNEKEEGSSGVDRETEDGRGSDKETGEPSAPHQPAAPGSSSTSGSRTTTSPSQPQPKPQPSPTISRNTAPSGGSRVTSILNTTVGKAGGTVWASSEKAIALGSQTDLSHEVRDTLELNHWSWQDARHLKPNTPLKVPYYSEASAQNTAGGESSEDGGGSEQEPGENSPAASGSTSKASPDTPATPDQSQPPAATGTVAPSAPAPKTTTHPNQAPHKPHAKPHAKPHSKHHAKPHSAHTHATPRINGVSFYDWQSGDTNNQTTVDDDGITPSPTGSPDHQSSTSYADGRLSAEQTAYIALNPGWAAAHGLVLGDVGKLTYKGKSIFVVYGDNHVGDTPHAEISVKAVQELAGHEDNLTGVHYTIYPGTHNKLHNSVNQSLINKIGAWASGAGNVKHRKHRSSPKHHSSHPSHPGRFTVSRKIATKVTTNHNSIWGISQQVGLGNNSKNRSRLQKDFLKWGNIYHVPPNVLAAGLYEENFVSEAGGGNNINGQEVGNGPWKNISGSFSTSNTGARGYAQFEPQTWATYGVDGNGDSKKDPENVDDAIASEANLYHAEGVNASIHTKSLNQLEMSVRNAAASYYGDHNPTGAYASNVWRVAYNLTYKYPQVREVYGASTKKHHTSKNIGVKAVTHAIVHIGNFNPFSPHKAKVARGLGVGAVTKSVGGLGHINIFGNSASVRHEAASHARHAHHKKRHLSDTSFRKDVVRYAEASTVDSYVWGAGHSTSSILYIASHKGPNVDADCSGFEAGVVAHATRGKEVISNTTSTLRSDTVHYKQIGLHSVQPGNFYEPESGHITIVTGVHGNQIDTIAARTANAPQPDQVGPETYTYTGAAGQNFYAFKLPRSLMS